ncbi:MAG: PEP-CTERM sorting domain-containing protein [Verrucomicrobia bacterium]|nr:PEP-CTERM sorting domain-containing protein [Verrucomicrobiota bacterium]
MAFFILTRKRSFRRESIFHIGQAGNRKSSVSFRKTPCFFQENTLDIAFNIANSVIMKKIITLVTAAGMLSPAFVFGQVSITEPNPNAVFNGFIDQMESDKQDLYVVDIWRISEGPPYTEIFFDSVAGDFWTNSSPGLKEAGSVATHKFVEMTVNLPAFLIPGNGGIMDVGYFGNSSIDLNELILEVDTPVAGSESLFLYDEDNNGADPDDPPRTVAVVNDYAANAVVRFAHDDLSVGVFADQSDENKFKMFQAVDPLDGSPIIDEYIFAIDDRTGDAIDFDDGFFYVNSTPVPEPSQIAALALLGLGGFLYVRRRRTARK